MSVVIRATRTTIPKANGTQDITISGFNSAAGGNPKAAIFIASFADTDATAEDDFVFGIGFTDGTNQCAFASASDNGDSTMDTSTEAENDRCMTMHNPIGTTFNAQAVFDSWITDGVRIDWTNYFQWNGSFGRNCLMTVILIGGTDVSVAVGDTATATSTTTETVGFEPDIIFAVQTTWSSVFANATNGNRLGFGIATNEASIVNRGFAFESDDAVSTSAAAAVLSTSDFLQRIDAGSSGAISHETAATSFASTSWSHLSDDALQAFGYLAISLGGAAGFKLESVDSPTSTGNSTLGSASYTPQFALMGLTALTAENSAATDGNAGTFGLSVMDTDGAAYCTTAQDEDGQGTSDAQSFSDDIPVNLPTDDGGSTLLAASTHSMVSGGVQLNFTTADATARKWFLLTVEDPDAGGGGGATPKGVFGLALNGPMQRVIF